VPVKSKEKLIKLLAGNIGHTIDDSTNSSLINSVLETKARQDFQENKTTIVEGWVLSVTEARQWALFH
jgi:hypothetical protein